MGIFDRLRRGADPKAKEPEGKKKPGEKDADRDPNKKGDADAAGDRLIHWEADVEVVFEQLESATNRFTRTLTEAELTELSRLYQTLSMSERMTLSNKLARIGWAGLTAALQSCDYGAYLQVVAAAPVK